MDKIIWYLGFASKENGGGLEVNGLGDMIGRKLITVKIEWYIQSHDIILSCVSLKSSL